MLGADSKRSMRSCASSTVDARPGSPRFLGDPRPTAAGKSAAAPARAILAPALAGFLLEGGWTPQNLYVSCALVFLLGIGMLVLLRTAGQSGTAETLTDPRAKEQV